MNQTEEHKRSRNNASDDLPTDRERGKLRIFFGYAPGVGKTRAMLKAAQRRRQEGVDVLVAQLQPNPLASLDTLLEGVAQLPDAAAPALNIPAVLAKQPQLAVVDDLAYINPPGALHRRRYQDVEELLEAGIDVYTTLNVQHIESLKDVVSQITGVNVQANVPDHIVAQAHQIELVDILPEDLIQRWREGKISLPAYMTGEGDLFFRKGNLSALRELALRQVARQVDEQMRSYMQDRAIAGPWATSERLLVCVSPSPMSANLVRAGCRLAQEMNAPWHAVYVEGPAQANISDSDQTRLNETMRLAENLGAIGVTVTGQTVADTLLEYARQNNITQIIIGRPLRSGWQELIRGSIVNRLIRRSGKINIHVISADEEDGSGSSTAFFSTPSNFSDYVQALIILALMTLAASLVNAAIVLNPANLVMFYLLAVVIVALRSGYGPAVAAAVLSVIAFNFFFIPPQYTLRVAEAEYLLTFLGLLVAGVVIANLTARARRQTEAAQRRERETAQLFSFSRELSATVDPEVITGSIVEHAQKTFGCDACLFLPQDGQNGPLAAKVHTAGYIIQAEDYQAANWVFQHGRPAGRETDNMSASPCRYLPLKTAHRTGGVLALHLPGPIPLPQQRLMDAFASQAANALEATQLGEEARQTQILREKEKLQSALLNSISHDLRTPLVSITGALSSLRENDSYFDGESRWELLDGAYSEADRLNRLVGNLLDMTRLESQSLKLKRELYDVQEVIGVARSQLRHLLSGREVIIKLPPDLPLVPVDQVLIAQVLVNLLDNAVKYSPSDTPIEISAEQAGEQIVIAVADRGVGVPEADLDRIFEKFYRVQDGNSRRGSGLGLSICQGIVESHDGTIQAQNREGGGACFIIKLPLK
jgi:two-component system sensor histidine kinase KdpD